MYKFVAYSCIAAAVAYAAPSPDADADAHYGGYGLGVAHVGVATAEHTITTPKCTLTFEEIKTQNCVPKTEKVCDTKDVEQQSVTFEKECKEVTSKVCGGPHGPVHGIIKREAGAEAEAEAWGPAAGLLGHGIGAPYVAHAAAPAVVAHAAPAVVHAPAAVATGYTTIKSDCREVTKEVCVNTPKTVSKTVPVTQCHLKQTVDCHEVVKKIPKKNCEAVETKVTVPVPVAHPAPVAVAHPAPVAVGHVAHAAPVAVGHVAAGHVW